MFLTDIHTHRTDRREGIVIRAITDPAAEPETFFTAGLHPEDAQNFSVADFQTLWADRRCIAIGECGLDRRFQGVADLTRQKALFLQQAEIAEEKKLPLVIHSVRTHEEIRQLKAAMKPEQPWILHGFRGNERSTFSLLGAGFYLSFGEGLLKDAGNMESFFQRIPLERIFFETDESNADLIQIYALAASMHSMTLEELSLAVRNNFERIFTRYGT